MPRNSPHKHAELLSLCHAAYGGEANVSRIQKHVARKGYEMLAHVDGIDHGVADAYIFKNRDQIVVAFQATESRLHEWRKNLNLGLVRVANNVWVHRGFNEVANERVSVRVYGEGAAPETIQRPNFIEAVLEQARHFAVKEDKPISFCGHSLGGALACIATERTGREPEYADLHNRLERLITFGTPRVGNSGFRLSLDKAMSGRESAAYITPRDVVPQTPPGILGFVDNMPQTRLRDRTYLPVTSAVKLHGLASYAIGLRAQEGPEIPQAKTLVVKSSESTLFTLFVRPPALVASYVTRVALAAYQGEALGEMGRVLKDMPLDVKSCVRRVREAAQQDRGNDVRPGLTPS